MKEELVKYAQQMDERFFELLSLARNLALEWLACGIDYIEDSDPKKQAYKALSESIGIAVKARKALFDIAIDNVRRYKNEL